VSLLSTIYLAAEDKPTIAVGHKLVSNAIPPTVYREENGRGYGTLKRKAGNYQKMAALGYPVLLITDLDRAPCPTHLQDQWLNTKPHELFLFRIAVREVEAWFLADRLAIAAFLHVRINIIPDNPEQLNDPKRTLLYLAGKAPRKIREGLLPEPRSKALIGPEYNKLLTDYVAGHWNIAIASNSAPSLRRAVAATKALAAKFSDKGPAS
jgi:hypothetical protein